MVNNPVDSDKISVGFKPCKFWAHFLDHVAGQQFLAVCGCDLFHIILPFYYYELSIISLQF